MTSTEDDAALPVSARLVEQRSADVGTALGELAGMLVGEQDLPALLRRVADLAMRTIPSCSAASVTLVNDSTPQTVASTDALSREVDQAQYAAEEGPCLHAMRSQEITRVDLAEADHRWPDFTDLLRSRELRAALAAPLVAAGQSVGALNLFSTTEGGFDALDDALIAMFCAQASVALANGRLYDNALSLSLQLQEAMDSRSVIEQAKGVLMARSGIDEQAAFDQLRSRSQAANRKLREIAADVVASTAL